MGELYPQFLDCGYSPLLFEELSPAELMELLDSNARRQEFKRKEYLSHTKDFITILDGFTKNLIENISVAISGGEYKNLTEMFSYIGEEKDGNTEKNDSETAVSPEMQLYMAQRRDHAYRVNRQRKKKEG